ncbi:MAG: alkaline phosphatase [Saprospiraceae bacterium]
MKRRDFFRNSGLGLTGSALLLPFTGSGSSLIPSESLLSVKKKAKNIIFMVSDGMSQGTLTMGDLYLSRSGKGSHWINLYKEGKAKRAIMDMASASSMVTDSSAASSSWGGGHRVPNGKLNFGANGEEYTPILQKFKSAGKKVGCVTTVPITHATPAGFCIINKSRGDQAEIADQYLALKFDVMMGGGSRYFDSRDDKKDMYTEYSRSGYNIVRNKTAMNSIKSDKPVLGVFDNNALPYLVDRKTDSNGHEEIPTLADMTSKAIELMRNNKEGFCLQVESGKVDWAAHANDAPALIYDQVQFEDAVRVAIDFAEADGNTLVIITSDHGNANPGLYYGSNADTNFDKIFDVKASNETILNGISKSTSVAVLTEFVKEKQGFVLDAEDAKLILSKYEHLDEVGTYNPYKLPFKTYGEIFSKHFSIAFGGVDHSADYTELCMFGPGSEHLKPFVRNVELHNFMLQVAEVDAKSCSN